MEAPLIVTVHTVTVLRDIQGDYVQVLYIMCVIFKKICVITLDLELAADKSSLWWISLAFVPFLIVAVLIVTILIFIFLFMFKGNSAKVHAIL